MTTLEERARELRERLDQFIDREGEWNMWEPTEHEKEVERRARLAALEEVKQAFYEGAREHHWLAHKICDRLAQAAAPAKEEE